MSAHSAYAKPVDGGWAGYQGACWDCAWEGPIYPAKDTAREDAAAHRETAGPAPWPKRLYVCDHCGHWHGASYNSWPDDQPPNCKIKGYGQDGKSACGRQMRVVYVEPVEYGGVAER